MPRPSPLLPGELVPGPETMLANISASKPFHLGNNTAGQVFFVNRGNGYHMSSAGGRLMLGPAPTLALGLTEVCAKYGYGKVGKTVLGGRQTVDQHSSTSFEHHTTQCLVVRFLAAILRKSQTCPIYSMSNSSGPPKREERG